MTLLRIVPATRGNNIIIQSTDTIPLQYRQIDETNKCFYMHMVSAKLA